MDHLSLDKKELIIQNIGISFGILMETVGGDALLYEQISFIQIIVEKTGDPDIARKAGRFGASSKGLALTQQYVTGLMNNYAWNERW